MTLHRLLLLPKPSPIHLHILGLPKSTRWFSSSPNSDAQKPPHSQKHRAVATVKESDKSEVRGEGIFTILDMYFKLAEWPNMLTIINRLNGMVVDGKQLIAQPAPIFPPPVLEVLWSKPDERIHVKSVLRRLLQNNEVPVELSNLVTKYHGDKYFE